MLLGLEMVIVFFLLIQEPEPIELGRMDLIQTVESVFDFLQDAIEF
jgi:hypothetical protein